MQIRMTSTRRGCADGFTVRQYHENCIYNVADAMGVYFLSQGWAERVEEEVPLSMFDEAVKTAKAYNKLFVPRPTRGTGPQNPATLAATGKDGDAA